MSEPIQAVFFDFGGVFIGSPFAAVERAAAGLGHDPMDLLELVFGSYASDTDHPWHRLERGELSFDAARVEIGQLASERGWGDLDPLTVLSELGSSGLEVREYMVDAVRMFRDQGIKTGVITNNVAEFGAMWRGLIPVDTLFDDVVDSSDVGVRKPNAAIFHLACDRLGVAPSVAAFIDDFQGNVDGAISAGLAAVCCGYTDESTRVALGELQVLVAR